VRGCVLCVFVWTCVCVCLLCVSVSVGWGANNESSEVCGIIKPGRRVKLNRSQAVNVHKLLTIRYLRVGDVISACKNASV